MSEVVIIAILASANVGSLYLVARHNASERRQLWRELHRLQAVDVLRHAGPVAAAVYQSADEGDERSDFQRLEDTPHYQNRDTMPIGL